MIIITGASDGVGLEIAKLYKDAGKKVVNISRRESVAADVNIMQDMRQGVAIQAAAQSIKDMPDRIEAVINSIGVFTEETFGNVTEDEVKRLMSTNVKAPMMFISELFERIKKDEADILNIVSKAGTIGSKATPLYAASKWAERGFTLSLQEKLKDTPCRVISFCPGGIGTGLFNKADTDINTNNWMSPEAIALFIKQILDLPKNMEVGEVIINRKAIK
ncbi:MAG: SDR family NAD(P)-dependent oxidoreductase [Patescibacteria group bacterium]